MGQRDGKGGDTEQTCGAKSYLLMSEGCTPNREKRRRESSWLFMKVWGSYLSLDVQFITQDAILRHAKSNLGIIPADNVIRSMVLSPDVCWRVILF